MTDQLENRVHPRLLRGRGTFTEDSFVPDQLHMVVLRSPVAHGRISRLDTSDAATMPGVHLVLTATDLDAHGIAALRARSPVQGLDGPQITPRRTVLAEDRTAYVGHAVAAVFADTPQQAADAAEAIVLEIDDLPAVSDPLAAQHMPAIHPEAPLNLCIRWETDRHTETLDAIAKAPCVVELTVPHPRMTVSPIETRAALATFGPEGYTLTTSSQNVVYLRTEMAACLGVSTDRVRVISQDVGGSFAVKIWPYPEQVLVLLAARLTSRAVGWTGTRSEAFVADAAGRGRIDHGRLAFDSNGKFLAFSIQAVADIGAFCSPGGVTTATSGAARPYGQAYDIPAMSYAMTGVFTNAPPTDAFRGAGKPESGGTLERLIDAAARQLEMDPWELRKLNMIRPDQMPFTTAIEEVMDAADFPQIAKRIEEIGSAAGLSERRKSSETNGLCRGQAIGFYVHATGGSVEETSEVRAMADGTVRVRTGSMDSGQGHLESLARLTAKALDLPRELVIVEQGDSAWLERASGAGGSNLIPVAGNTIRRAAEDMLIAARSAAAEILEVADADLDYGAGTYRITGTDRTVTLAQIAEKAEENDGPGCLAIRDFEGIHTTWPNGALLVEVEVDPQTGAVRIDRMAAVTDLGEVINPDAAEAQIHGAIGQAVGEALSEAMVYDTDGQPLNASMMDYALPRADDLAMIPHAWAPTDSPNSYLNAKGVGELASNTAPGIIMNAVIDALAPLGVRHIEMPLTPLKVWQAIRKASE